MGRGLRGMGRHQASELTGPGDTPVEDVDQDLAADHEDEDVRRSLAWLLEAARPLAVASWSGLLLNHG